MQRSAPGFEASYRRHLAVEQRRAFLDALARNFEASATVGEIVDAAAALGWLEIGELSLADLADAILLATPATAHTAAAEPPDDEDDADDDDDDEDEEQEVAAAPARGKKSAVKGKPAKPAAAPKSAAAKPAKGGKVAKVALDDRMSLDEAAAVLLPLVRAHGEATMEQLEQSTAGAGRRKLRFHIGQLVKNGRLERHGMGRGTFYTVA